MLQLYWAISTIKLQDYLSCSPSTVFYCNPQSSYHIPDKISQPVEERLHSTNELQVLGFVHSLLDEEDHKAGWDEGHGENDADGHQNVNRGGHPGKTGSKYKESVAGDILLKQTYRRNITGLMLFTYSATCESCSLVRFSGWLKALMANLAGSSPAGRFVRRMPLFITLRKAPILCQPLLLNQICTNTG